MFSNIRNFVRNASFLIVIIGFIFYGTQCYYKNKLSDIAVQLNNEKAKTEKIETKYNEQIGKYTTKLAYLESNLKESGYVTDKQKNTIKILEKELNAKINEVSILGIQIDSLQNSGQAQIIVTQKDTIRYTISEKKNGVGLYLTLWHPQGTYSYTIKHDPLTMELYMAKDKSTGFKVGSVIFPNNDNIKVSRWDILYDPDTRAWYQKFLDDIKVKGGILLGDYNGVYMSVGYKKISLGQAFIESGKSYILSYEIKD